MNHGSISGALKDLLLFLCRSRWKAVCHLKSTVLQMREKEKFFIINKYSTLLYYETLTSDWTLLPITFWCNAYVKTNSRTPIIAVSNIEKASLSSSIPKTFIFNAVEKFINKIAIINIVCCPTESQKSRFKPASSGCYFQRKIRESMFDEDASSPFKKRARSHERFSLDFVIQNRKPEIFFSPSAGWS